jgi:putative aldouronate transport system permease protein
MGSGIRNINKMIKTKSNIEYEKKLALKKALVKYRSLYIILAIIIIYYIIFSYIPIIMGVMISLKKMRIGSSITRAPWVGLDNYLYVIRDPEIWNVVKNSLQISVLRLFWGFWPSIVLAICIFDLISLRYKKISQTIVYIPYFFSWVIVYGIVFAFFSGNGFVNTVLGNLGFDRVDFLMSTKAFRPMLIGSQIWKGVGWGTILYFAALSNVSPELYEAAKIDGAGPIARIRAITLPTIMPIITFSLIMALGNILNNDFEQILMFYNPAVYEVGDIIDTWVYRVGLGQMQYGVGAAVGLMKAVISLVLIIGANSLARKTSGRGLW